MLQAWVSPAYALVASEMAMLIWGISGYWTNSYWGGAVAATGGALVFGAIPRLWREDKLSSVLAASLGVLVLANSRPFEGLLVVVAAAGVFAWRRRQRPLPRGKALRAALIVALPAIVSVGFYNSRTTGNPLVLPYVVHERTYAASPFFYVLPTVPTPAYRHDHIRAFWAGQVLAHHLAARAHPEVAIQSASLNLALFYLANPFGLAILGGLAVAWTCGAGAALLLVALPLLGLLCAETVLPHYLAPAFGALLILGALGLEALGRLAVGKWKMGRLGVALLLGVSLAWCALSVQLSAAAARTPPSGIAARPLLIDRLHRQGGRHLVIVRYGPAHYLHDEWVYNRADIDRSEIVWAQDMGAERNRELLDYYPDRTVWLLQPDLNPVSLTLYR
jgi:hypothetical protein